MTNNKAAALGFGIASLLAFVAGFVPLMKGERLNVVFMSVGVVFLVLAAASVKKKEGPSA